MNYDSLSRALLLKNLYDKMSEDDKKTFIMMHLRGNSNAEIMEALSNQSKQLTEIHDKVEQDNWVRDFGANIAGNAAYSGILWLLGKLFK